MSPRCQHTCAVAHAPALSPHCAATAAAPPLRSLLGLFWGAYQTYKVLKPRVIDEEQSPDTRRARRRRTLVRFADGYDAVRGAAALRGRRPLHEG